MTDTALPTGITKLSDRELLGLYLSLQPTLREKAFINTARAAKITGVSMRTIQLWIEGGSVRAIVVGRKYRIVAISLTAHLERQMDKCASDG